MIRVGIIGAGRITEAHLNALRELSGVFVTVAVCDPVFENAERYAKVFHDLHIYKDHFTMLKEEDIDLAVIATPNGLHYKLCKELIESGLNVLVEKPLALTYREAEEIVNLASLKNIFVGVVTQKRLLPLYKTLKSAIDNGKFGKIYLAHLSLKWSRPEEYFLSTWRGTREMDGGIIFNQAMHNIDILDYLLSIVEVFAYGGTFTHNIETEDNVVGVFKTKSGAVGSFDLTISLSDKNMGELIEVFGEKGRFLYGTGRYESLTTFPAFLNIQDNDILINNLPTIEGNLHKLVYSEVADAIENGGDSVINAKNVLHSILVAEAIMKSLQRHETIFI